MLDLLGVFFKMSNKDSDLGMQNDLVLPKVYFFSITEFQQRRILRMSSNRRDASIPLLLQSLGLLFLEKWICKSAYCRVNAAQLGTCLRKYGI